MTDELEPEILSYREFRDRETLLAWQQRRRAFETGVSRRSADPEFVNAAQNARPGERRRRARPGAARR